MQKKEYQPHTKSSAWPPALLQGGALLLLAANMAYFYPFFTDDALISLRYAERWAAGQGLTWNDGEYVEGYSNTLWVLLCGGLNYVGMNGIWAARLLGIGCTVGTGWALYQIVRDNHADRRLPALWVWAYFSLIPVGVWAIAGLEMPLVTLLLLLAVQELLRPAPRAGRVALWLSLLCLTRPDAPLLVAALVLGHWWASGWRRWRVVWQAWPWWAIPAATVLALTAFRRVYFQDWLPNTAYVKVDYSLDRVLFGVMYVLRMGYSLILPGSIILFLMYNKIIVVNHYVIKLILPAVFLWLAYVASVGGDFFPAFRMLLPVIPLGIIVLQVREMRAFRLWWAALVLPLVFVSQYMLAGYNWIAKSGRGEWLYRRSGYVFKEAFQQAARKPLVGMCSVGALPYFSGLPFIDMLGLTDRTIARTPVPPDEVSLIGHDRANAAYVLARRPDIVVFDIVMAGYRAENSLLALPLFQQAYTMTTFTIPDNARLRAGQPTELIPFPAWTNDWQTQPHVVQLAVAWFAPVWGMDTTQKNEVTVPGVLLGQPPHAVTWADGQGFTVSLGRDFPRESIRLGPLAAGTWQVETVPRVPARFRLSASGDTTLSQTGVWVHPGGAAYLTCAADTLPARIHALHLTRIADVP